MHLQAETVAEPVAEGAGERGGVHHAPGRGVGVETPDAGAKRIETRLLGREHFASDILVGTVLGYAIGSHIFHTRCNPERSDACPR